MSTLESITLTQFRNFPHARFSFREKIVGITGLNGIGKTNLLDAIYYLCFTKSYFQSRDKYNVQHHQNGFRISGTFMNGQSPEEVTCVWKDGKKTFSSGKVPYEKISEHIGKYSAVMIAPDDSDIITGSGEYRRKFFDGILCLKEAGYLEHLLHYNKVLQQKNAYLKMQYGSAPDHNLLNIYDAQLAAHGAFLIEKRMHLTSRLPEWVSHFYRQVSSNTEEAPRIAYEPNTTDPASSYRNGRQRETEAKRTLWGPHLDDWSFFINDSHCKAHASQGQKKSFLISLKLSQIELLSQSDIQPILLLDDIFEKLDPVRLRNLFNLLQQQRFAQIFMTHTNAEDIMKFTKDIFKDIQIEAL